LSCSTKARLRSYSARLRRFARRFAALVPHLRGTSITSRFDDTATARQVDALEFGSVKPHPELALEEEKSASARRLAVWDLPKSRSLMHGTH
jgi:hypothetical protein